MVEPYYKDQQITLYLGDARDILPSLKEKYEAIITDPVWPNSPKGIIPGSEAPLELFRETAKHFPFVASRAVVHLGSNSDPRFLTAIPPSFKFVRACHLAYLAPTFNGRVLNTHDIAYVFGTPPAPRKNMHLLPGIVYQTDPKNLDKRHPCPKVLEHVRWLVKYYGMGSVIDPFCGTGTTLLAAKELGYKAIGIEIKEEWLAIAKERIIEHSSPYQSN